MKILFVRQSDFAAFGLCAKGEKKQFVLQGNAELCSAVHDGRKIFCAFKAIDAPFHTIGAQCGKLGSLFQNGGLGLHGLFHGGADLIGHLAHDGALLSRETAHQLEDGGQFALFAQVLHP